MDQQELDHRFKYHPPKNDEAVKAHETVRQFHGDLASLLNNMLTDSREKSLAITKLEEAMMWANASIARVGIAEQE